MTIACLSLSTALISSIFALLLELTSISLNIPEVFILSRIINVSTSTAPYNFDVNLSLGTGHVPACNNSVKVWATLEEQSTETCYNLATSAPTYSFVGNIDSFGSFSHPISKDAHDENSGLVISYPTNNDDTPHYNKNLTVTLYCNSSASYSDNATFAITKVNSTIYVSSNSRYGKLIPMTSLNNSKVALTSLCPNSLNS